MSKRFYVTTAIDYVNGQPHLGHAYEKIVADVIARARRAPGRGGFFPDRPGRARPKGPAGRQAEGKDSAGILRRARRELAGVRRKTGLSNDDFVRTTEPRHKEFVQAILSKLNAAGHFYKATYKGFYSPREETFLTEKDRLPDGTFDPSYGKVIELKEENYYFKLGEHQEWLIDYIEANPGFHRARLSAQRSAGLPQKQQAGGPVHHPAGRAPELGHPDSVRPGLRHLRLVRRACQLYQHSLRARRSGCPPGDCRVCGSAARAA